MINTQDKFNGAPAHTHITMNLLGRTALGSSIIRAASAEPKQIQPPSTSIPSIRPILHLHLSVVDVSYREHRKPVSRRPLLAKTRSPVSIDASVRLMDHFNEASFHTWIKDQQNAHTSARHLGRVMTDYTALQVADGLRWLFEDWQLINIAVVLRIVLIEMGRADRCRRETILRLVTRGWSRHHIEHLLLLLRLPSDRLR